jgi:UDP-glucose 4-epimerase
MRVLVTGAGGFVGGVVADRLAAAGHEVTALVRTPPAVRRLPPAVEVVVADILDPLSLTAAGVDRGFDGVCHLAALTRVRDSRREPLRYFAANVGGTVNVLDAIAAGAERTGRPASVVLGSSCAVYGDGGATPIPETARPCPSHPYGASKLAAEQVLAHLAETGRVGAVVLRSFNIAGAAGGHGDTDTTRLLPAALATAAGLRDAVGVNGDGSVVREYVHVADLADAYVAALEAAQPGRCDVYNVGSGIRVTVGEVLSAVERVTGRPVRRVRRPAATEPRILVSDSRRIRAELGWDSPLSHLERVVADAWSWLGTRETAAAATAAPLRITEPAVTARLEPCRTGIRPGLV